MSNIGRLLKFLPWKNDTALPRGRLIGEWFAVLAFAFLITGAAGFSTAGKQLSFWTFDHELSWSSPPVDPRILIVQIDEASLDALGRWPWTRETHANLINRLTDGDVRMVGYDVIFTEPGNAADDDILRNALIRSQRVVLPAYVTLPGSNGRRYDLQPPLPIFTKAAHGIGHVNVIFDPDGQVRRSQMWIAEGKSQLPHMMQKLAQLINPQLSARHQKMIIPYNPPKSFASIPAEQIVAGNVPANLLKGRIVLVGASALGLGDVLSVPGPAGSVMPGVEVQANMLNALLTGTGIRDVGAPIPVIVAMCLLTIALMCYWFVKPTAALAITIAMGIMALFVSAVMLAWFRVWVSPVPLLVGLVFVYPLWNWRRLSALNNFVEQETRALDIELSLPDFQGAGTFGFDSVTRAANRLRAVIGELGDRRRFLRDVVEGAPDALCVFDANGRVVVANQIAVQLIGGHLNGSADNRNGFWDQLLQTTPIEELDDEEIEIPDGRTMLIKSAPLLGSQGRSGEFIVRIIDITVRKEIERQRNEFLEFLSHDMRAPQSNILRIIDLANTRPGSPLPLDRIRENAVTSLKLADDFVQLARLAVIAPDIIAIDLRAIAEEAIDGCFEASQTKKIRLELSTIEDHIFINADPWLLIRALSNLLDNAIKYSPESGVVTVALTVKQSAQDAPDQVLCEIRDNGPGIPPERLALLFERFGPNDMTRGLSAGLGLAFVKRTMDMFDADIECQSGNDGTVFRLTFFMADALD